MSMSAPGVPHLPHHVTALKLELIKAGDENKKLSDVEGYDLGQLCGLCHKQDVDEYLKLKLLHLAAWTGDVLTIQHLKSVGDANEKTEGGFTPLHLAASRGHSEALCILLEYANVGVETCSSEGFTALHSAAYGGHYECVQALLQKCSKAHVNARDKVMRRTALHWAACHTSSRKVFDELLRSPDVNVCSKDRAGFTPLHFATMNVIETELGGDKKYIFLEEIRNPRVRDETSEEWIKDMFKDETKRLQLEDMHKSDFSDADVEHTMQLILEGVPTQMVKRLLERDSNQVNDKVGDVRRFLSMQDVKAVGSNAWQKLSGITTIHPKRNLEEFMSGYTALHFATRQNNGELVTHLLTFAGIKANERDMMHGMTSLHCALLTGSMKACASLMSFEGVDVNAQLVREGQGGDRVWLPKGFRPPRVKVGVSSDELIQFRSLDTPLHMGIRFCPPKEFLEMMIQFCKHPKFNPAICNREGVLPLQLAWRRSHFTEFRPRATLHQTPPATGGPGGTPNNGASRGAHLWLKTKEYFAQRPGKDWICERRTEAFKDLQCALDVLEGHPGNAVLMNNIRDHQQRYQNIVSAVFISATVIASMTFSGTSQQQSPTDSTFNEDMQPFPAPSHSSRVRMSEPMITFFWFANMISFFAAFNTLALCLAASFNSSAAQGPWLGDLDWFSRDGMMIEHHRFGDLTVFSRERLSPIVSWLLVSFVSGLTAFGSAVLINKDLDKVAGHEIANLITLILLTGITSLYSIGFREGLTLLSRCSIYPLVICGAFLLLFGLLALLHL